jgi:hypothetical protein
MKRELITELFEKFEHACYLYNEVECWSARDLQEIFGYGKWDNFVKVIDKAKGACTVAGGEIKDHFADVGKMIQLGSGAKRQVVMPRRILKDYPASLTLHLAVYEIRRPLWPYSKAFQPFHGRFVFPFIPGFRLLRHI